MLLQILLCLQIFQVAILLLHDWIPLRPLNDVPGACRGHTLQAMAIGTVISSLFPSIGLVLSLVYLKSGWLASLHIYLLAAYGFLFLGELEAGWIPYLVWRQPRERSNTTQCTAIRTSSCRPAMESESIRSISSCMRPRWQRC